MRSRNEPVNINPPVGVARGDMAPLTSAVARTPKRSGGALVLDLEGLVQQVLAGNRGLADVEDAVRSARLAVAAAEADFRIQITPGGAAGLTRTSDGGTARNFSSGFRVSQRFLTGTEVSVGPTYSRTGGLHELSANLRVRQPLLRGLSPEFNRAQVDAADFAERSSLRNLHVQRVDTVFRAIALAYGITAQSVIVQLNRESLTRLQGHVEAAQVKERVGLASPIDTYRARIQAKQVEDALLLAEQARADALDELRLLANLSPGQRVDVEVPLTFDRVRLPVEEALETAFQHRVELDEARDALADAERRARVADHGVLPEVTVVFDYARYGVGEHFRDASDLGENRFGVSLVGSTDVFRRAESVALDQSLIAVRSAGRAGDFLRDRVALEVKRALRELERAEANIEVVNDAARDAGGQLELARIKFQHGLADNLDVIQAEGALRDAQIRLLTVSIDYIVGTYRLRAALGTLLERPDAGGR